MDITHPSIEQARKSVELKAWIAADSDDEEDDSYEDDEPDEDEEQEENGEEDEEDDPRVSTEVNDFMRRHP